MANYKGHLAGGIFVYVALLYLITLQIKIAPAQAGQWLFFALAGSLFPDVDIKSKGQYYFYWIVFITLIILMFTNRWYLATLLGIIACMPLLVRHRGIFHNLWFIVGMTITVSFVLTLYVPLCARSLYLSALFFCGGAFSHLVLDFGLLRSLRG